MANVPWPEAAEEAGSSWIYSGPVGVSQYEHRLGESVYLTVAGLRQGEAGKIGVFTPNGTLYRSFDYNGSEKTSFNQYFLPDTKESLGVCTPEQLVGVWAVVFADGAHPPLPFRVTGEWVESAGDTITEEC